MPNGDDRNVVRLTLACALYRERYGVWPTHTRIDPGVLWNIAHVIRSDGFERLCARLQVCSAAGEWGPYISMEGSEGSVLYGEGELESRESQELAREWLGIEGGRRRA